VTEDKFARASAFEAVFERGEVWIAEAEWTREWKDEVSAFPKGRKDDQVDSLVVAVHADLVKRTGSMSFSM
jgi:predicted phage terminase large subunit-like protein